MARSIDMGSSQACLSTRRSRVVAFGLLLTIAWVPAIMPSPARADGAPGTSVASAGASYAVTPWTIDGGGGRSSGGTYTVSGTIAQPDADPLQPSSGAAYAITGGFWPGVEQGTLDTALFADGFEGP